MSEPRHTDRARAESFGANAARYDRYRPAIPAELVDRFVSLRPAAVLDVACGTGKVSANMVARGLSVLGVELDARMADVARGHGVEVEVSAFETWDDAGRQFDLLTCGNAWHWLEPQRAADKAARLLRSGGTLARFWSYFVLPEDAVTKLRAVYDRVEPTVHLHSGRSRHGELFDSDLLKTHGAFEPVTTITPSVDVALTTDDWIGLLGTYSDHEQLGPERFARIEAGVREALDALGGTLHARAETFTMLSTRR